MSFEVHIAPNKAGERAGDVYELTDAASTVRAEVWPQWGFNCLRWQLRQEDGRWADVLFAMPDWESNPVPTRSGHPILFPFPGRLRDGKLPFEGGTYQLALTDNTKQHAIHGFTPRNPWRVVEWNGGPDSAFVTGEFTLSKDFPEALPTWPSDFTLTVTYRLRRDALRVEATVTNLGDRPLPFGLGYHPYFRLPGVSDADVGGHVLQANMGELWEAENNLPTGNRVPLPDAIDFREPKPVGAVQLDHVFTAPPEAAPRVGGLSQLAVLSHPDAAGCVQFLVGTGFQNLVLFTPAHRHAIAIEPYTCSADASNLAARGVPSNWLTVPVGGRWSEPVEYRWVPGEL
ncbi:aldose 1-epimerase : Aldose 1-epimerase OS=Isosphaera pallida (strain ATCC 43644 / DSM 9630 / IS1B) GN=Isop_0737 PE=4 SV=1: Aldose_epim [Gemmataceae bacterium]|nr:aldose 1-epimerase : Aldose 1-epimerase OS=Isosphaera pallida (strain ATCC 43644 / DSM 9630 / IS1B) GN=Isop_0737 PE=4 SV=1: Aldose_epim [Gemmataceae bacterium]VTT96883.1 aldose 1-epimerase : Aldose 1-epimerase OS=Isosphaera pallida (strain ATCC 43644 / DSM 9630 / IS1B) GN=Isop_0737 PE=4 SV=1: Aldose_epim [Gemmataceae bacterium]